MLATLLLATLLSAPKPIAVFHAGIVRFSEYGNRSGRPILLVPGLACGPWIWATQIESLSAKYDVYTASLPGFDARPMVGGGRLMQRAAHSIDAFIRGRRLQRPVLVGHSLGGTLAVLFGETYPRAAATIVTVEGGYPVAPTQKQRNELVRRNTAPYTGIPQSALAAALRENMLRYTITRRADVDRVTALAARSTPPAIVQWMRAALSLDLTPRLHAIAVPITAVIPFDSGIDPYQGFKSADAKVTAYRTWIHHAPRGRVVLIKNSRHFVMLDQPAAFERALERAIER